VKTTKQKDVFSLHYFAVQSFKLIALNSPSWQLKFIHLFTCL